MHKGNHLLVDCRGVSRQNCLNDEAMLNALAQAAADAGATVISSVRYHFGHDSPPGFTLAVLLDESHCTAHSYADLGLLAIDIFTCGQTKPEDILALLAREIDLGEVKTRMVERFETEDLARVATRLSQVETTS